MNTPSFLKARVGLKGKGFSVFCIKCERELDCFGLPAEVSGLSVAHIHDPHKRRRVCGFCDPALYIESQTPPRP